MSTKKHLQAIALMVLCFFSVSSYGQQKYEPSTENLETRQWFQNAKFGLFIHWGVYSIMGGGGEGGIGEWIMENKGITVDAYEKLPTLFNPTEFDAEQWVSMAKAAGMKYITITTKHHDGFSMFDSKVSDYDIVDSTPFGRDIFRELEQECQKQGLKLFAYYSQVDWHHPDYYPRGWTGREAGRPESGDWQAYLDYQNGQIKELAENYNIAGFWFDGWWDQYPGQESFYDRFDYRLKDTPDWNLEETYKIIHGTKSHLLIGSNHHVAPFPGEDFQMFEKDFPGENTTGFGTHAENVGQLPFEMCETINGSWGFNLIDNNHKSVDQLVKYVVNAAGKDANFLLNVGPMPNGKIQEEHVLALQGMGNWMSKYGETIYGTRGGPIGVKDKYVTTQKGDKLYMHVLNPKIGRMEFKFPKGIKKIVRFDTGEAIRFSKKNGQVSFDVPAKEGDIVTTLEIVMK